VTNPLLAEWNGPYGGVPPFDKVRVSDFRPALERAMTRNMAEINAISTDSDAPTFDNTIVALEKSGRAFGRVQTLYGVWSTTLSSPEFEALETVMAPRLAAFTDQIEQNPKLFARVAAVAAAPQDSLTPEQKRLIEVYRLGFVRDGAALLPDDKPRLSAIGEELEGLYARFMGNLKADAEAHELLIEQREDIEGLPPAMVEAAAAEAVRRGQPGKWVLKPGRASMEPLLIASPRRELREQVWRLSTERGGRGDANDNFKVVARILQLRALRAKLLGYGTFAHEQLDGTMARTPEAALKLLAAIWKPAVARFKRDIAELQALADREHAGFKIAPWDVRYYAEKLRRERGGPGPEAARPYLQLDRVREAMFETARLLYGYSFAETKGAPVVHADVRAWEFKARDGRLLGLLYLDLYARSGKQPGAWTNTYRAQEKFERPIVPIVSLNASLAPAATGQPTYMSWAEAESLFHEFGHALHALSSDVSYPTLAGDAVARDVVEFPGGLNARWLTTPEVMRALVAADGRQMPSELTATLARPNSFNAAIDTVEMLASAILDLKLHLAGETVGDPKAFEQAALRELGMPPEAVPRHRVAEFEVLFGADGYAASYYSFVWSDALAADAWAAFAEGDGPWDVAVAKRFLMNILSVGNSVDPVVAWRKFRNRDLSPEPLIRERGFA
jgi:peptidyl-dipeptidase Dcp